MFHYCNIIISKTRKFFPFYNHYVLISSFPYNMQGLFLVDSLNSDLFLTVCKMKCSHRVEAIAEVIQCLNAYEQRLANDIHLLFKSVIPLILTTEWFDIYRC